MKLAFVVATLVLATFASAQTTQPDLSTPKAGIDAYMLAWREGSEAGMRAASTGGENAFAWNWAGRQCITQQQMLVEAIVKQFGEPARGVIRAHQFTQKKTDEFNEQLAKAKVEENGDKATVAIMNVGNFAMVKVDGYWKRDLAAGGAESAHALMATRNQMMLKMLTQLTAEVDAGQHASAAAVKKAFDDRIKAIDAKLTPAATQPATAPAAH